MLKDIKCGNHSGFKPCCVSWYVTAWQLIIQNPELRENYHKLAKLRFKDQSPGYIPCPRCIFKADFTQVKKCNCRSKLEKFGRSEKTWDKITWNCILNELDWT